MKETSQIDVKLAGSLKVLPIIHPSTDPGHGEEGKNVWLRVQYYVLTICYVYRWLVE
jgi:hypothetical protein